MHRGWAAAFQSKPCEGLTEKMVKGGLGERARRRALSNVTLALPTYGRSRVKNHADNAYFSPNPPLRRRIQKGGLRSALVAFAIHTPLFP